MHTILYKQIPISYTDTGSGKAIVLLHGFLENKNMWSRFVPELAKKNRIITIDLLGHGDSACLGYIHAMEDMAMSVHFILTMLKVRKASFVGHSMGGYVSLAFAELFPKMVRKIMLLNSTSKEDSPERKANRDRAIEAVKTNRNAFIQIAITNLFSPDNREKLTPEIESVKEQALQTPLQGIIAAIQGMKIRKDRFYILAENIFPITLVAGEKDPVLDKTEMQKQAELTHIDFKLLPDGHMSAIENYEEVLKLLIMFSK